MVYNAIHTIQHDITVPQKGYAKRGSNRQITNNSMLNHLQVTFKSRLSHLKVTCSWNPF